MQVHVCHPVATDLRKLSEIPALENFAVTFENADAVARDELLMDEVLHLCHVFENPHHVPFSHRSTPSLICRVTTDKTQSAEVHACQKCVTMRKRKGPIPNQRLPVRCKCDTTCDVPGVSKTQVRKPELGCLNVKTHPKWVRLSTVLEPRRLCSCHIPGVVWLRVQFCTFSFRIWI